MSFVTGRHLTSLACILDPVVRYPNSSQVVPSTSPARDAFRIRNSNAAAIPSGPRRPCIIARRMNEYLLASSTSVIDIPGVKRNARFTSKSRYRSRRSALYCLENRTNIPPVSLTMSYSRRPDQVTRASGALRAHSVLSVSLARGKPLNSQFAGLTNILAVLPPPVLPAGAISSLLLRID